MDVKSFEQLALPTIKTCTENFTKVIITMKGVFLSCCYKLCWFLKDQKHFKNWKYWSCIPHFISADYSTWQDSGYSRWNRKNGTFQSELYQCSPWTVFISTSYNTGHCTHNKTATYPICGGVEEQARCDIDWGEVYQKVSLILSTIRALMYYWNKYS